MQETVFDLDHLPRTYFKLALPVMLGMVVTLIYNLADTYFIARTGVTDLVAGVSLCSPVFTALMAFGNIYGQGGSSLISRMLGKNDRDGVRRVSSFCFYAAIATVIGYACGDLFLLVMLRRRSRYLSVDIRACHVSGDELRQILLIGVSAALTNLMSSLSLVLMNKYLAAYGSGKVAAMGIVLKINMIAQCFLIGLSFGGVPLFGYLYGADDRARLGRLTRFCLTFLCALAAALSLALALAAPALMAAFVRDGDIISDGAAMLRWQTAGNVFAAVVMLLTCLFQATGRVVPSFALSVSRQGVVFIAVLAAATALAGYDGLLAAQAVADLLSAALALALYAAVFGKGRRRSRTA